MAQFGLILFASTHDAMAAEGQLKQKNFQIRLISTPHTLDASCGFSIKYPLTEESDLFTFIHEKKINIKKIFHAEGEGFQLHYHEIL